MQITQEATNRENEQVFQQYLTFLIAGEEYAVDLLKVKEIIEYDIVTPVPKTPEWIRGVINLRGNVVPVVDLAVKFRLAPSVPSKLSCIVITEVKCDREALVMGVMTDAVRQVIDLKAQDIEAPPEFGTRVKVDYLLGMARSGKKFCLLLDTDKVLSMEERLELPQSPAGPGEEAPIENTTHDAVSPEIVAARTEAEGEARPE